jgi:hypothetical protein
MFGHLKRQIECFKERREFSRREKLLNKKLACFARLRSKLARLALQCEGIAKRAEKDLRLDYMKDLAGLNQAQSGAVLRGYIKAAKDALCTADSALCWIEERCNDGDYESGNLAFEIMKDYRSFPEHHRLPEDVVAALDIVNDEMIHGRFGKNFREKRFLIRVVSQQLQDNIRYLSAYEEYVARRSKTWVCSAAISSSSTSNDAGMHECHGLAW